MASKNKSLKAPILDDEHDYENTEEHVDIKENATNGSKTEQLGQKESQKSSKSERENTLGSNSTSLAAASTNDSKLSHVANDISAYSTANNQGNSSSCAHETPQRQSSSSMAGLGWVSFEDESAKKNDLVTQQQTSGLMGTPLSPVVNGDVDHKLDHTQTVISNVGEMEQYLYNKKPVTVSQDKSNTVTSSNSPINGHVSQNGDELSSPSWVTFEEDFKGRSSSAKSSTPMSSPAVHQEAPSTTPLPSWVTFDETSKQMNKVAQDLTVNVTITEQSFTAPGTPSPNPFLNAPMSINIGKQSPLAYNQSPSPLSVVTNTNPFHSEDTMLGLSTTSVQPFPLVSQPQQDVDLSQWHDVSVLERGFKPDGTVKDEIQPIVIQPEEAKPIQSTKINVVDHIEKGIVVAATVSAEEKPTVLEESDNESLDEDFSLAATNTSWSMFLRYPDKKKKITPREWKSVVIKLDGNTLQIYEEDELSAPFREIPLQASFSFDPLRLQPSGRHGKVHTTKLVYLNYKETRSVRQKGTYEHIADGMAIIKIGSQSHIVMREFTEAVGNSIRTLPAYRDRGITYRKDEVFVDVDDTCYALVGGDGSVKRQGGNVLVKVRAFLTGDPECQLVINDVVVKEREETRLRGELKPQRVHHWIKLRQWNFHKCVDNSSFDESHAILFHPLDACTFELMRFRVKQEKPLPLYVKASLIIHSEQRIELSAEIKLCQDTKMAKYSRNNVTFRLPIPETWVPLFRTGGMFGREKSIKSSKGKRAAGIKSRLKHSKCSIAASLGTAQYEPEYGAVVWRIDKLPLIQSKVPVDAPQTLNCVLELPSGMECPENYRPYAELEYDVSHVLLSDTTVIAVKVSNRSIPEKWVCYRAFYQYHIDMDIHRPSSGPVKDVGCAQQ